MNKSLHVLFVTPSVSRLIYGIYEVERNLALELSRMGVPVDVVGLSDECTQLDLPNWLPLVPSVHQVTGPNAIGYSKSFSNALMASQANTGHIHSLWSYTTYALYKWAQKRNAPYLVTPNGMLDEWALKNSKWKKDIARFVCIDKILRKASCIQVNTMAEYDSVRALGFSNPICIISNGVNLPDLETKRAVPWAHLPETKNKKILLYLSRIHPKKGVHLLLEAWNLLAASPAYESRDWHLVVVGFKFDENAYERELLSYITEHGIQGSISTLPEQHGAAMAACYSNCDAFILPSFSEGVPIAALNAWAYAKPAIVTSGCNIDQGFNAGAAIKVEPDSDSIKEGIRSMMQSSVDTQKTMGLKGRALVELNFSWKAISSQMKEVYDWMLCREKLPAAMVQDEFSIT